MTIAALAKSPPKICANTRLETFQEAVDKAKRMKQKRRTYQLIVDGGTENNNKKVEAFVKEQKPALREIKENHYAACHFAESFL